MCIRDRIKAVKLDDNVVKEYEEVLAKIDGYSGQELGELMVKYNIGNPCLLYTSRCV